MLFWTIVAIVAGFFLFCIIVLVIGGFYAKKHPKNVTAIQSKTPLEYESEIRGKTMAIRDRISSKTKPLQDRISNLCDRQSKIIEQTRAMLDEYLSTLDRKSVDPDFAELLSVYDKSHNLVDEEYLTALQKCKDKGLTETKKLCDWTDEREKLKEECETVSAQYDEWSDVYWLNKRDVWNNPECEDLFKQLYALENDEVYKERIEKSEKWKKYLSGSIVVSGKTKHYHLGRQGNTVAIWSTDDYEGREVSIDDIMYFQISVETKTSTYTNSTGKPSKLGTAINEAIFGTAAATASAMQKNQQNTTTYTNTQRKAMVYFKYELGIEPLEVSLNREVDKLIAMMPEKQK